MKKRMCYFIPVDGFVDGHGWRVSIVTEGESGHTPTGSWPYDTKKPMPYFWGHDEDGYDDAVSICDSQNKRLGLSEFDVIDIISSSMSHN